MGEREGELLHEDGMAKGVEEPLDVGVEYIKVPELLEFLELFHRLMAVAALSEAERAIVKRRLETGVEEAPEHLLGDAVAHGGYAGGTEVSSALLDVNPTGGEGVVGPPLQLSHQGAQGLIELSIAHLDAPP